MKHTALNYQDFTLKAIVSDATEIEATLRRIGATFVGVDHQHDTYYKVSHGKLKWRCGTIENLITHYERIKEGDIERTIVYRYDLNPTVEEINELSQAHEPIGVFEKERKIFLIGDVKVHLDRTPDGKNYIELEAIDRTGQQPQKILRGKCLSLQLELGIHDDQLVSTGYF